jgi:hypothetical protein
MSNIWREKNICLYFVGAVCLILLSCENTNQKIQTQRTERLYFTIDTIIHHNDTAPAYNVMGKIHNNSDDSIYYFECDKIINCGSYRMKRQGEWSTTFSCFGERENVMVLPHSYRNIISFFYDRDESATCLTDTICIDLTYFYSSDMYSLRDENICFGIDRRQIRLGRLQ